MSAKGEEVVLPGRVKKITVLKKGNSSEAMSLLQKCVKCTVKVMEKRGWVCSSLNEFVPKDNNLLGLNINRSKIMVRLRPPNNESGFYPFPDILGTWLHELTHMQVSPHNAEFDALLNTLWDEVEAVPENVAIIHGWASAGSVQLTSFDGGKGHVLGGGGGGGRKAGPSPAELRRRAVEAAARRWGRSEALSGGSERTSGGGFILGAGAGAGAGAGGALSPAQLRALAAEAAENRRRRSLAIGDSRCPGTAAVGGGASSGGNRGESGGRGGAGTGKTTSVGAKSGHCKPPTSGTSGGGSGDGDGGGGWDAPRGDGRTIFEVYDAPEAEEDVISFIYGPSGDVSGDYGGGFAVGAAAGAGPGVGGSSSSFAQSFYGAVPSSAAASCAGGTGAVVDLSADDGADEAEMGAGAGAGDRRGKRAADVSGGSGRPPPAPVLTFSNPAGASAYCPNATAGLTAGACAGGWRVPTARKAMRYPCPCCDPALFATEDTPAVAPDTTGTGTGTSAGATHEVNASSTGFWACPACTYHNEGVGGGDEGVGAGAAGSRGGRTSRQRCAMCDSPRPA